MSEKMTREEANGYLDRMGYVLESIRVEEDHGIIDEALKNCDADVGNDFYESVVDTMGNLLCALRNGIAEVGSLHLERKEGVQE